MSKLKLLNLLKEEVTEQGYGRYFKDVKTSDGKTVGDSRGFDFTTNKPFDKDYKNPDAEVETLPSELEDNTGTLNIYVIGKKGSIDKNGPYHHQLRPLGDWQSDNATDIFTSPGTPVYSITKGKVSKIGGNENKHKGKIYGGSVTVTGTDGYPDIFYTHMQKIKVTNGQTIDLGTQIGEISNWETNPSGSHVHIGLEWGSNLDSLLDLNTGKIIAP